MLACCLLVWPRNNPRMKYDRKPTTYGGKPVPAKSEPSPAKDEAAEKRAANIAQVHEYLRANPHLGDLEQYPPGAFAGMGRRFAAYLLDCLIVMPTMLIAGWMLGTLPGQYAPGAETTGLFGLSPQVAKLISKLLQLLLYDVYFTATLYRWGGTWGMKCCDLIVLRRDLALPTKGQARGRYWAAVLSALPLGLGFLAIGWDKRKRGWHDRMAGTYVVRGNALTPGIVAARTHAARSGGESSEDEKAMTTGLLVFILTAFAPGLIVLGLTWLLLRKVGIIKRKPETKPAA